MENEKDFSIIKWLIFPALVLLFGSVIVIACVKVFGWDGAIPTILCLAACFIISLIYILQTGNKKNAHARTTAFIFECAGLIALVVTAICGVVVMRQFSGATQTIAENNKVEASRDKEKTEQLKIISGLKTGKAQANAVSIITPKPQPTPENATPKLTLETVYERAENLLVFPSIAELLIYVIGLITVFGMCMFKGKHTVLLETVDNPYPKQQTRTTFLPRTAQLQISTNTLHKVDNGNGFSLSLSPQGATGVSIRFAERGMGAKHVIRIPIELMQLEGLAAMNYAELAAWSLRKLENEGKQSKAVYQRIKDSL